MRIDILTLFPEMFAGPFSESMLGRAQENGLLSIAIHDIRAWADNKHSKADDYPFGGGAGLVMMAQTLFASQKEDLAEILPPEVKPHLPAIKAAVKSLSCRQNGKKVTLGMKVEIVKLAAAILPSVM